ncbi:MAG TPA: extracellular solute-binding protein, partial [Candidatus Scybalocola faecigallinarum]|nr:extracellular solute-binding protein [Candidatus Scybalocola faecigallinarum]
MGKRFISSLLAVTMAASLAAGCGSASSDGNGTDTAGSGTDTASAGTEVSTGAAQSDDKYSEENPYHLTFAYIEFYQQDDAARTAVQDAINDYMIPNYHIEVELLPMESAEYQRKAQLMMSGGDAVDVLPIQATLATSWINMGGIYDMTEFMDTEEGQAIVDALGEELAYAGSMNGILYGFPANKEYVELGGLCMRADICDELGITEEYGLEKDKDEYD